MCSNLDNSSLICAKGQLTSRPRLTPHRQLCQFGLCPVTLYRRTACICETRDHHRNQHLNCTKHLRSQWTAFPPIYMYMKAKNRLTLPVYFASQRITCMFNLNIYAALLFRINYSQAFKTQYPEKRCPWVWALLLDEWNRLLDYDTKLQVKSTTHYQTDTMPRTDASLLAHLAPSVSCSSSGCQTSSWSAVGSGFKTKFDHDHPHYARGAEAS